MQLTQRVPTSGTINYSAAGTILFEDSFEDADLGTFYWDSKGNVPDGWFIDMDNPPETIGEVTTEDSQDGSVSVKFYAASTTTEIKTRYSAIIKRCAPSTSEGFQELYMSWYSKIVDPPPSSGSFIHMFISSGQSPYGADKDNRLYVTNQGGEHVLHLSRYWDGLSNENYATSSPIGLTPNTWYHYEVYWKYNRTDGEYRIWFDGDEVITLTGLDTTPRGKDEDGVWGWHNPETDPTSWEVYLPKGMDVGILNMDKNNDYTVYLDNVLIANYNYRGGPPPTNGDSQGRLLDTSFESGDPYQEVVVETSPPPSYPQDQYAHGVVTGSQEQAHTGLWSAKLYSQDGGPAGRCRLNWPVDATKILYVRAYFYIESWDGYIQALRFWSDHPDDLRYFLDPPAGDYVARLTISPSYIKMQLGKHSGSPTNRSNEAKTVYMNFETGRWYALEMLFYIHPSNGQFRAWLDDEEVTDLSFDGDTETGWCKWITEVRAGVVLYQQNVAPATVFFDDYAIDNEARIGL